MDMSAQVGQATIFLPVLVVVALVLVAYLRMGVTRGRAAKGVAPNFYRAYQGTPGEPEYAVIAARHYNNLFELPVLFYVGAVVAFEIGAVSRWLLVWAWAYVACRLLQSFIHLTYNNATHRALAFTAGFICVIAMWVVVATTLFAQV